MRRIAIAALGALFLLSGCQTQKSYSSCDEDVERLKAAVRETAFFFEALEPEIERMQRGFDACNDRLDPCEAAASIARLDQIKLQLTDTRSRFTRAVDVWNPDACLPYSATYRLNPPDPERYKGFYFTFEAAEQEIEDLIDRFEVFAYGP